MSEIHDPGRPERVAREEQREVSKPYALLLYADFSIPKLGESRPLGRILDEEIFMSFEQERNGNSPDDDPLYWIGNNKTAGWRSIRSLDDRLIWEAFMEVAKDKLLQDAMSLGGGEKGTGYWYQKFVNRRQPGSDGWKEWSGNPPEIRSSKKS
jgi:hypothetical protein